MADTPPVGRSVAPPTSHRRPGRYPATTAVGHLDPGPSTLAATAPTGWDEVITTGPAPSLPRLGELIQRQNVAVAPGTSIVEAAQAMRDHGVGCLVVAGPGRHPTVVTERDVTMAVANGRDLHGTVRTITGSEPLTLATEASALDAAMALLRTGLRFVVVTSEDNAVGIVTAHDVMAALAEAVVPERLFLIAVRRPAGGAAPPARPRMTRSGWRRGASARPGRRGRGRTGRSPPLTPPDLAHRLPLRR